MNCLKTSIKQYLKIRRDLGFKLESQGNILLSFARFAEVEHSDFITTALVIRWSQQASKAAAATLAERVEIVRRFASWHSTFDVRTEIPPAGLLPHRFCRQHPYIYSNEEITKIVTAAAELKSSHGLRAITYATFFALMASTGMRIGEAVLLERADIDFKNGLLMIRHAKFGKERLLPLHKTTINELKNYANQQDRILGVVSRSGFFVIDSGRRITEWSVRYTFAKISQKVGIRPPAKGYGRGPRIHDLRHRFAVNVMIEWYRKGKNVEAEIPKLATYLGHTHVSDTYWYIEGVPELLQLATARLQASCIGAKS
jgi:integrase